MKWVYNITTPRFKSYFMMTHPLQLFMSRKVRKEEKTHGENPPSRNDKEQNLK